MKLVKPSAHAAVAAAFAVLGALSLSRVGSLRGADVVVRHEFASSGMVAHLLAEAADAEWVGNAGNMMTQVPVSSRTIPLLRKVSQMLGVDVTNWTSIPMKRGAGRSSLHVDHTYHSPHAISTLLFLEVPPGTRLAFPNAGPLEVHPGSGTLVSWPNDEAHAHESHGDGERIYVQIPVWGQIGERRWAAPLHFGEDLTFGWVPTIAAYNVQYRAQEWAHLLAGEPLVTVPLEELPIPEYTTAAGRALCAAVEGPKSLRQLLFGAAPGAVSRICSSPDLTFTCFKGYNAMLKAFLEMQAFQVSMPGLNHAGAPITVTNRTLDFEADIHCAPLSIRGELQWACHCRTGPTRMMVYRAYFQWAGGGASGHIVCHEVEKSCHALWHGAYFFA